MPTVREYGQTQIRCDRDDVEFLLRMVRGGTSESIAARVLQSLTPTTTPDLYTLTAGPYVGRLALPSGTTLDFLPRFSFLDTLEVIRVAHRLPARIEDRGVDADEGRFLIDMLAQAYSREMTRIAARGLLKNYTDMRHRHPPYPGRLDAAEHLRLFAGRPDRLITRSHRLSVNVPENQLLARALEVLRRTPLNPEVRTRVQALQPVLAGVSASASSTTARQRPISSLSAYYVNALALARVILRGASLMPIGAGSTGAVVLYGMNRIWEDYVATRLRDTYGGAVRSRLTFQLGGNAGWTAEADAVTVHAGKITALVDAKYKPVDQAPSRDDAYQMISYCEALGLSDASLVYPGEDQHRIVQVGGKTLHIRGLQPGCDIDWGLAERA